MELTFAKFELIDNFSFTFDDCFLDIFQQKNPKILIKFSL